VPIFHLLNVFSRYASQVEARREETMHRKWLAAAYAAIAIGAFAAAMGTASAEETAPGAPPVSEEAPPASEETVPGAPPVSEETVPGAPPVSGLTPLDETCNNGYVCVWTMFHYQGAKGESLCTGGPHPLAGFKGSAKNRCANKAAWLRVNGIAAHCVNPANNFPESSFGFNELWIGAEGSRC
jgi:hypothetical protein